MIKVCDAIMGTGKSQSAIAYMNEHKDEKFIYITPYLEEANRIKNGCPELRFIEPNNKIKDFHFKKSEHTAALIKQGRNIATTHQAFKGYTDEMREDVEKQGYTLIIDENVDILEKFDYAVDDIQMAIDSGYIQENDDIYSITDKEYHGKVYSELFKFLKTRKLIRMDGEAQDALFYWVLPPELIMSFKDVFILTYLFKGQGLHHFLEMHNLPYEYIGIAKTDDGTGFKFSDPPGYVPEYVSNLKNMLHILDVPKLNDIGKDYHALSMNWYERNNDGVEQLRRNISNCFKHVWNKSSADDRLWSTFNKDYSAVRGKGYTKSFLTFNAKATNEYRNKRHLVYMVNIFMNTNDKIFYQKHGVEVDEEMFALSIMVQWIWRSAIRDGEEVYLYIPSRRMRELLTAWIDDVSKGGNKVA